MGKPSKYFNAKRHCFLLERNFQYRGGNKTLGTYELRCPEISKDLKELFKTHGVVVLRDVFPPDLLEDLLQDLGFFVGAEKSQGGGFLETTPVTDGTCTVLLGI